MGEIKTITFQFNISFFTSFRSPPKYTSKLIFKLLAIFDILNLLYLQTVYPIATNKNYQNFITDIVKLK